MFLKLTSRFLEWFWGIKFNCKSFMIFSFRYLALALASSKEGPYFSFFRSYLNYGGIAWASTTKSKLRKVASQHRQAVNAIPKNDNQEITNSRKFMEENGILNVYKLNLYQVLNFMFRVHNETIQKSFQTKFQYIEHKYETRQSKYNFIIPKIHVLPVLLYHRAVLVSGIHSPIIQLRP